MAHCISQWYFVLRSKSSTPKKRKNLKYKQGAFMNSKVRVNKSNMWSSLLTLLVCVTLFSNCISFAEIKTALPSKANAWALVLERLGEMEPFKYKQLIAALKYENLNSQDWEFNKMNNL
jgi:hypothetical protein